MRHHCLKVQQSDGTKAIQLYLVKGPADLLSLIWWGWLFLEWFSQNRPVTVPKQCCAEQEVLSTIYAYLSFSVAACLLLQLSDAVTPQQAIDSLRELRGSRAIQTIKVMGLQQVTHGLKQVKSLDSPSLHFTKGSLHLLEVFHICCLLCFPEFELLLAFFFPPVASLVCLY